MQPALVSPPQKIQNDQDGGNILRNHARRRHTIGRHVKNDNEIQVQNHVQHTGNRQIDQRASRIIVVQKKQISQCCFFAKFFLDNYRLLLYNFICNIICNFLFSTYFTKTSHT